MHYFIRDTKTTTPRFIACQSQTEDDARREVVEIYGSRFIDLEGLELFASDRFESDFDQALALESVAMPEPIEDDVDSEFDVVEDEDGDGDDQTGDDQTGDESAI